MRTPEIAVRPGDRAKLRRARDFGIVSCEPNGPSAPRRPLHRVRLGVLAARHAGAAHGGRPHRLGRDGCAWQVAGPARQHQPPEEAEGEEGCPQARQGSSLPPLAALLPPPAATVLRPATRRARRILSFSPALHPTVARSGGPGDAPRRVAPWLPRGQLPRRPRRGERVEGEVPHGRLAHRTPPPRPRVASRGRPPTAAPPQHPGRPPR